MGESLKQLTHLSSLKFKFIEYYCNLGLTNQYAKLISEWYQNKSSLDILSMDFSNSYFEVE